MAAITSDLATNLVTAAVALSAFVALTLTPTLCVIFLKNVTHEEHKKKFILFVWFDKGFEKLQKGYIVAVIWIIPESVFTGSAGLKAVALANFPPLAPGQTRAVRRRHREKTAAEAHYSGL